MTRHELSGAIYGFALPDGSYGGTYPDHIELHTGRVEYPGEDILFLVGIRYKGVLYLAGQGHRTDTAWLWNGQKWTDCGKAYGVSPCAFGDGQLFISASPTHYTVISLDTGEAHDVPVGLGSQGIRYIENGQPVSGDATYTLETPYGLLHEYTRRGDVICGQAHEGDWAILNGRVLEQGTCRFIRMEREGDSLAITLAKFGEHKVVFCWLTVSEITSLPKLGTTIPTPEQPQPPEEKPPVSALEAKALPQDVHEIIVALHARNLALANGSDDDRRVLQKKICETVRARKGDRWGWKSNHGDWSSPSKDGIAMLPDGATFTPHDRQWLYLWDCFSGSTRQPNTPPIWNISDGTENQYFIPVEPIDHLADVPPPPKPEPPPAPSVDLSEIRAQIADILQKLNTIDGRLREHDHALEVLEQKPAPVFTLPKLRVKGDTSRIYAHAHKIDLEVVPE